MAAVTDVGLRRQRNEDAVRLAPDLGLAVVADGIGGSPGGDIASALAAERVVATLAAHPEGVLRDRLTQATLAAGAAIIDAASENARLTRMGTTLVAALLEDWRLCVAHLGDSRAYRWRRGMLQALTRDHSLLEQTIATGVSRSAASRQINRNVITRALGAGVQCDPDFFEDTCEPGDLILLCSDGLNGMLDDAMIADLLRAGTGDLEATAGSLVAAANAAGGYDNITVALIAVPAG